MALDTDLVSDDQHLLDAFAEKNRAEAQLHEALVAQARLRRPPTAEERANLDSLAAFAENANKLWVKSWPVGA